MSVAPSVPSAHPVRWGLAARLFAILLLLGAVAVLVTGLLGYIRARDALQESIYNQLTAARKSKAAKQWSRFSGNARGARTSKAVGLDDAGLARGPKSLLA